MTAEKLKEHKVHVAKHLGDVNRLIGRIEAIQKLVAADGEAFSKLATLRLDLCTLRAGAHSLLSDLGVVNAPQLAPDDEEGPPVLHSYHQGHHLDGKSLAAGEREEVEA